MMIRLSRSLVRSSSKDSLKCSTARSTSELRRPRYGVTIQQRMQLATNKKICKPSPETRPSIKPVLSIGLGNSSRTSCDQPNVGQEKTSIQSNRNLPSISPPFTKTFYLQTDTFDVHKRFYSDSSASTYSLPKKPDKKGKSSDGNSVLFNFAEKHASGEIPTVEKKYTFQDTRLPDECPKPSDEVVKMVGFDFEKMQAAEESPGKEMADDKKMIKFDYVKMKAADDTPIVPLSSFAKGKEAVKVPSTPLSYFAKETEPIPKKLECTYEVKADSRSPPPLSSPYAASTTEKSTLSEQKSGSGSKEDCDKWGKPPPKKPPPGKSGFGVFGIGIGVALGVGGGLVAYSSYDESFREKLENQPVIGPWVKYLPKLSSSEKPTPPEPVPSEVEAVSLIPAKKLAPIAIEVPGPPPNDTALEAKLETEEDIAERMRREEEQRKQEARELAQKERDKEKADIDIQNAALEDVLKSTTEEAMSSVFKAVEKQRAAIDATHCHSTALRKAMDVTGQTEGVEGHWQAVTQWQNVKSAAIYEAEDNLSEAQLSLTRVAEAIQEGKKNKVTQRNKALSDAEKTLASVRFELDSIVAELEKAQSELQIVDHYRELIRKGREQFKKELESIVPNVRIGTPSGKMTEEDLNSLIAHAHRRIEQLQQQIAQQQCMEQQRIESALMKKQCDNERQMKYALAREQQRLQTQFEAEKMQWDARARVQFEEELRQHLARQAAAHSDHLTSVLRVQEQELQAKFCLLLEEKRNEERNRLQADLANHISRMKGIEHAVDARAELEQQARSAQVMFLACQKLQAVLNQGKDPSAGAWDETQLKPLEDEIKAIESAGIQDPVVCAVLGAIPPTARSRGVWTTKNLEKRFEKVSKIAKRVAMVGEEGGSVFQYSISYLQSLFMFSGVDMKKDCTPDFVVDTAKVNAFYLTDMAKGFLAQGQLELAVKVLSLLEGQPRVVASDWLHEARMHLEVQQAVDALSAIAQSRAVGALW